MKRPWQLGSQQMWVWVITSYGGLGYVVFPRLLYQHAGSAALYSLLLGIGASFLCVHLNAMAASVLPGKSLAHLAKAVLGEWGGIAFEIGPFLHQLAMVAASLRLLGDLIHTDILQRTPPGAIILCTSAVVLYVAYAGLEPVTRMFQFWLPSLCAVTLIAGFISVGGYDPVLARPHFVSWDAVWSGFVNHFYMYGGIATLSMVLAFTDVRRAMPWLHVGATLNSLILLVAFFSVAITIGPFMAIDTEWPVYSAARLADLPGFIFERTGWPMLLVYMMYMVMFQAGVILISGVGMTHLFGLPDGHFKYFLLPFVGLTAAGALFLIPDRLTLEWLLTGILMYSSFFIAIVKPLILYLGARMRGLRPDLSD
jgi:hypothetical protein